MINKKIEDIKQEDLQALIDNKVLEGKTIEYKREFPNNSDSGKKEFLADVSSFANASGGDLIFGIEEDTSTREPRRLIGLEIESIDNEKARLDNIIRTGVEPRLLNITIEPILLGNSRYAILIRVPLYSFLKLVLHLIPINAFNPSQKYDINSIVSNPHKIQPIYSIDYSHKFNLDGFLTYIGGRTKTFESYSYVQLYRNGIIEAVEARLLNTSDRRIYSPYEKGLIESLDLYLKSLAELGVEPPLYVFLSLLGVKDYKIVLRGNFRFEDEEGYPIDRGLLLLPEAVIDNYDIEAKDVLRPLFDLVWNVSGFPRSLNFDEAGNWISR